MTDSELQYIVQAANAYLLAAEALLAKVAPPYNKQGDVPYGIDLYMAHSLIHDALCRTTRVRYYMDHP